VHTLIGAMLAVQMAVMQVVNVVAVQHRFVSTPRAVGVTVEPPRRVRRLDFEETYATSFPG
jgi:hypothetical protein